MSENIAGYIDREFIKGQYYRTAGCPKPIVFTGNINNISDDVLVKAMFVSNGTAEGGDFPTEAIDTYLITNVEYGNGTYLQTAVSSTSGYEYRRIYSGGAWTDWIGTDSNFTELETTVSRLVTDVGANTLDISSCRSDLTDHDARIKANLSKINGISSTTSTWSSQIKDINTKVSSVAKVFGPKVFFITNSYTGGGSTSSGGWISDDIIVNIKHLGLKSVIAVIPGIQKGSALAYGGWTYLKVFNTEKIIYNIARLGPPINKQTKRTDKIQNRIECFIIIGT